MIKSSLPSHDGFGSALRNAPTLLKSKNSVKTEPWVRSEIRRDGGCTGRTYLESLSAIDAPHTDSRHFSVFDKESLKSLLKTRKLLTEAFLQGCLAAASDSRRS